MARTKTTKRDVTAKKDITASSAATGAPSATPFAGLHPAAFFLLTAGPPLAVLSSCLDVKAIMTWLPAWTILGAVLPNGGISKAGGHALAFYASYSELDPALFGDDDGGSVRHMTAAVGIGLVMGVAYRNLIGALRWVISTVGETARPERVIASGWAPSVVIPLPTGSANANHQPGEFTVKVLLPTATFTDGMVYNERRTLQCFLNMQAPDQPQLATLVRQIATKGEGGGTKAYFTARREAVGPAGGAASVNGEQLRIFVDRVLPPPLHW